MTYKLPASPEIAAENPKVKAAKARANSLTSEERKAIARKAALTRWETGVPTASHEGEFPLGSETISAAVLPNGKRVITQATFLRALGRSRSPKAGTGVLSTVDGLPFFLQAEILRPFISDELRASTTPVFYLTKEGGRGVGYDAELLPRVCEVYLAYRDWCLREQGRIPTRYEHIITACDILMRGLAHVGIIALVDEATGYQYDRARTALVEILEAFVAKELRKWVKTFPDEFYQQICRLRGWKLVDINKRPMIFSKLTNYLIYKRLAPGVLKELHRLTPKIQGDSRGRRKRKLFQRLTEDIGHPRLRELITSEIVLMRIFDDGDWTSFEKAVNRAIPIYGDLPLFDEIDASHESSLMVTT